MKQTILIKIKAPADQNFDTLWKHLEKLKGVEVEEIKNELEES